MLLRAQSVELAGDFNDECPFVDRPTEAGWACHGACRDERREQVSLIRDRVRVNISDVRDYLQNFLVPRLVTENCLRRGFAPN